MALSIRLRPISKLHDSNEFIYLKKKNYNLSKPFTISNKTAALFIPNPVVDSMEFIAFHNLLYDDRSSSFGTT